MARIEYVAQTALEKASPFPPALPEFLFSLYKVYKAIHCATPRISHAQKEKNKKIRKNAFFLLK